MLRAAIRSYILFIETAGAWQREQETAHPKAKRGIAGPPPPPLGLPLLGIGGPSVHTRTTSSRGNVDVLIAVAGLYTVRVVQPFAFVPSLAPSGRVNILQLRASRLSAHA